MRKKYTRLLSFVAVYFMLALYCATAQAALQAAGPLDPVSTLPTFYQDTTGRALTLCLDTNGFCVLPPFDQTFSGPITTTGPITDANFPNESFYFLADSVPLAVNSTTGDTAILRLAFEAAFLGGVVPDGGITFLRINLKKMAGLPPNSTYTVTHPYGSFQFTTNAAGVALTGSGAAFRTEDLSAPPTYFTPPAFAAAANTHMGPFLTGTGGLIVVPGAGTYIGNPAVPTTVTGSPTGNNFFRIDGPNIGGAGINTVQTSLFTLQGKVFTGQIPSPMSIDRITYARDAATGQVDAFVTALPASIPSLSGIGIAATNLAEDFPATGKFFAHIPFATSLPTSLVLTNSLDIPPISYPINLVDEVNIVQAIYDPVTRNLTVKASSRDKVAPLPVLTVPTLPAPHTLDATGTLVVPLPANTIPPKDITVASSNGGSATAPVSVLTPPPVPVTVADTATTPANTAVVIDVLANDTPLANINPASLVISTQSLNGLAVVNANGTVTFTPAAVFFGTTTFDYTVNDTFLQTSAPATVSVTVTAPPAPVTVDDTATTAANTAVVINVLANDTPLAAINPASVAISTQSLNGLAVVNANGSVTFTPTTGFSGIATFAYTVKDSFLQTSNVSTVTVTVTAPPAAPVAVADTATTTANTAVVINVIANDTPLANINPASLVITTQSLNGLAVANANGTVTFTPTTGFSGSTTFAYTVKDTTLQTSDVATVTVTVTAPALPVAVNDTATTTAGTAVVISVLANDTAAGTINTTSVAISTQPLNGTAAANINGTVTFTPAAGFSGGASFTYTFKDNLLQTSNAATVTVTVSAPPVTPPLAVNDTATTPAGSAVVINVLANDVAGTGIIDPASVVVSTQSINGSAVADPTGTVTFTPSAGFVGSTTFAYTVKNTLLQVSNPAIVTVSVTGVLPPSANIAPVANNDVASTVVNTSRVINVIANDTDVDGTINPASVIIVTPPVLGTAVNNLDGTITYTSATAGTGSFTYNVKDNIGAVSNNATVTVSVTSAITDSVNVLRAEYISGTRQWTVEGTTTNVSPLSKNVTLYIGTTTVGNLNVLGTAATNTADGRWKFILPGAAGNPSPAPTNTISVALPSGASRLAFPVAVK